MSPLLSSIIFASAAAAQVTTSIWLPGAPYGEDNIKFKASVVGVDGDAVTMAIGMDSEAISETITYHGTTAYENIITTTDSFGDYEGDLTVSYGCTKKDNKPACTYSYNGPVAWSSECAQYTDAFTDTYTYTRTFDGSETTVEEIETRDYRTYRPDFCTAGGSVLPDEYAIQTVSDGDMEVQTFAITITAGENKLSATAGATPTGSSAPSTFKVGTASATPTFTGTSGNNSTGPAGSPSPTAPAEQSTGAAAPMMTLAPALAGVGALVAALL